MDMLEVQPKISFLVKMADLYVKVQETSSFKKQVSYVTL